MDKGKKILYIDSEWKVMHIEVHQGIFFKQEVSLETALVLLLKEKFDLILTEPMNLSILGPKESIKGRVMNVLNVLTC
jgi:hypothetical protein